MAEWFNPASKRSTAQSDLGNQPFIQNGYLEIMRFKQTRLPLWFLAGFFGLITALFGFGAVSGMDDHNPRSLPIKLFLIVATALMAGLFVTLSIRAIYPMSLDVDEHGITCRQRDRSNAWTWDQISHVSLVRLGHAAVMRVTFNANEKLPNKLLPDNWPGGAPLMVARLNAAKRQYADPHWNGVDWRDITEPRSGPVLGFVMGAFLGLGVCAVLLAYGLGRLHH